MKTTLHRAKVIGIILIATVFFDLRIYSQKVDFIILESSMDWQNAIGESKKSGKDIFLDIYATWCGPCKMMDANVFTNPEVGGFYNSKFINLKVDGESDFGRELAGRFSLSAYPSMFFINSNQELIHSFVGYREPLALIKTGQDVSESGKRYMELLRRLRQSEALSKEQTSELLDLLVKFDNKNYLKLLALKIVDSYTLQDILNPANKTLIMSVTADINNKLVKTVIENRDSLKSAWGMDDFNTYLSGVFNESMVYATVHRDSIFMERIAMEFIPLYMKDNVERIPEVQLTTRKIYFTQIQDWNNYIQTVEKHRDMYHKGNPLFLYNESYYIIENQLFNPVLLGKSNEWLQQVVAVQPGFESYFLIAIVNTYLKDLDSARKWISKAEVVAVSEDQKSSLEELRKYMEAL